MRPDRRRAATRVAVRTGAAPNRGAGAPDTLPWSGCCAAGTTHAGVPLCAPVVEHVTTPRGGASRPSAADVATAVVRPERDMPNLEEAA